MTYWVDCIFISTLFIGLLLFQHNRDGKRLEMLIAIVRDIRRGNTSRRFLFPTSDRKTMELMTHLNHWIDDVQKQAVRLEQLDTEYREILSHLSHDLRTPLTSLLGYAEMLRDAQDMTEEERAAYITIIYDKALRIQGTLSRFFELAQLESSNHDLVVQPFNIVSTIHEVMLSFYHAIERDGITVKIHTPQTPVIIQGDSRATERILMNLISNALRYGMAGGVLGVDVREDNKQVKIDVWDQGQGILVKDLPYIFQRLYTGQSSRNATKQGSGLGLTIVKVLVRKQGWDISVESKPFEKTTFSVIIPVN